MDSINSWINEDEVRKLAEELTKPQENVAKLKTEQIKEDAKVAEPTEAIVDMAKTSKSTEIIEEKPKPIEIEEESEITKPQVVQPSKSSFEDILKEQVKNAKLVDQARPNKSIADIFKEETSTVPEDGKVRIPNELKAEKALKAVSVKDEGIPKEIKDEKALALAKASEMAISVGLIKEKPSLKTTEATALCDTFINAVPVNIDTRDKAPVVIMKAHSEKGEGTFGEIDKKLNSLVEANGICVIDRDGDVLYTSLENNKLVSFTIDTMMKSTLMHTKEGEIGNVRLKLSADDFIEFVAVKSTRGVIVLSTVLKDSLGNQKAKEVADQMLKIANAV